MQKNLSKMIIYTFKMSSLRYKYQLNSFNGNDLSCMFSDGFNSFINNASSIFVFIRLP